MIYANPTSDVLNRAHVITLYDPQVPDWNLVVVDAVAGRHRAITWNVVDIPVDSCNADAIRRWKELIRRARGQNPGRFAQDDGPAGLRWVGHA